MMLGAICRELNNWFDENPKAGSKDRHFGEFVVKDGAIDLLETGIKPGQYFRIVGSILNDGVYQHPASGLTDETFDGAIWLMYVPNEVLKLAQDIEAWEARYGGIDSVAMSPFQSESFGGYNYSKGSNSSGSGGSSSALTWQAQFASQLNKYRKIRP